MQAVQTKKMTDMSVAVLVVAVKHGPVYTFGLSLHLDFRLHALTS